MRRTIWCLALLLVPLLTVRARADATGTFHLGGLGRDHGWDVAMDGAGNLFVSGSFRDTVDFAPGPDVEERTAGDDGVAETALRGRMDAFVVKYDPDGKFAWVLIVGGSGVNLTRSLAVDEQGGLAVAGQFSGRVDFDPSDPEDGADTLETAAGRDAFVARYDSNGSFLWVVGIGDEDRAPQGSRELDVEWSEGIRDVAIGPGGKVYVAGMFRGTIDLDPGEEAATRTSHEGSRDAFLACYDPEGRYLWDAIVGGEGMDQGHAVAIGPGGRVALGGVFEGMIDFDTGPDEALAAGAGGWDVFIAAYEGEGELASVWTWGGKGVDQLGNSALAFDAEGAIYGAGSFEGSIDFDPSRKRVMRESQGASDAFLVRYDAEGKLDWAHTFGGSGMDRAMALLRDRSGRLVVAGRFTGEADFDPSGRKRLLEAEGSGGATDAFVACYGKKGKIQWARAFGAELSGPRNITYATGLTRGRGEDVLTVGTYFGNPDLDPSRKTLLLPNHGSSDVFVLRYDAQGKLVP